MKNIILDLIIKLIPSLKERVRLSREEESKMKALIFSGLKVLSSDYIEKGTVIVSTKDFPFSK